MPHPTKIVSYRKNSLLEGVFYHHILAKKGSDIFYPSKIQTAQQLNQKSFYQLQASNDDYHLCESYL